MYRDKARNRISNRIDDYAPKLGVSPASLMIKDQEKRWASCTSTNGLIFNWRSILAPAPVLDYIIVHELCHLLEKSHSKRFWALVRSILPEYELRERWLRENGVRLDL
jgi:predicted metal-dependent hydrolase